MSRQKSSPRRPSLASMVSLGLVALGIGCICWASVNIWAQTRYSADAQRGPSSGATTLAAKQVSLARYDAAPVEPNRPSEASSLERVVYTRYPRIGDKIGTLSIPVLKMRLPIIEGTGASELRRGVGHYRQSVLPGEKDNCVLSGHRDTVFTRLGTLKIGDRLVTQTSAGTFTYRISRIRIVDKSDRTVIVPANHAVLTVTTCYPFRFVGNAPKRYVLTANLVASR